MGNACVLSAGLRAALFGWPGPQARLRYLPRRAGGTRPARLLAVTARVRATGGRSRALPVHDCWRLHPDRALGAPSPPNLRRETTAACHRHHWQRARCRFAERRATPWGSLRSPMRQSSRAELRSTMPRLLFSSSAIKMRLRRGSTARWSMRPRTAPRGILASNSRGAAATCCAMASGPGTASLKTTLKPSAKAHQLR